MCGCNTSPSNLSFCPTHLAGRSMAPLYCSVEAVSAAQTPSWPSWPPFLPPGRGHHCSPPDLGGGGGRRHCVCTCMDLEKNQVPLPMPFLSSLTPSSCLGLKKILIIIYSAIHSTCTKECPEIIYIHTCYIELCIVKTIHRAHRPSGNAYVLVIM